ncbi:cell division protein SepF [archaeon]|jgi:SepF-like predicted cell division protein (DUF552 family)|nr:cell division protein SepF [archaeon]MBT4373223.1 cell division protein SepF [archaeon]MBT4531568.1 cell division protein SepF [archaeon]MBT7001254.1 cell division protein SepF [archaeon]MBT7282260.1 cell division protein SepF [archaeon]
MVFDKIKRAFSSSLDGEGTDNEYLEIDLDSEEKETKKVLVKLFVLKDYNEVNAILNVLREGYTIAVIDISVLKKKDPIELKRAISKIKKTTEALEGNIAGFLENTVIVTPAFAKISREVLTEVSEESKDRFR